MAYNNRSYRGAIIGKVTHSVSSSVEVHAINDALEQRIGISDGAQMCRELLADYVGECADH